MLSLPWARIIITSIARPTLASHALIERSTNERIKKELLKYARIIEWIMRDIISVSKLRRIIRRWKRLRIIARSALIDKTRVIQVIRFIS